MTSTRPDTASMSCVDPPEPQRARSSRSKHHSPSVTGATDLEGADRRETDAESATTTAATTTRAPPLPASAAGGAKADSRELRKRLAGPCDDAAAAVAASAAESATAVGAAAGVVAVAAAEQRPRRKEPATEGTAHQAKRQRTEEAMTLSVALPAPGAVQEGSGQGSREEMVRRAIALPSCETLGVTLHTLWLALSQLQSEILSPVPSRGSPYTCNSSELASLLCFDAGRAEETLLRELKTVWEGREAPRPEHDQLQMRLVQWLWLWVRKYGVTDLSRLASLVPLARADDLIARNAPPNAPSRERRDRLSSFSWDGHGSKIPEEEPGVLAARPAAHPAAADVGPADAPGYFLRASQEPVLLLTDLSATEHQVGTLVDARFEASSEPGPVRLRKWWRHTAPTQRLAMAFP